MKPSIEKVSTQSDFSWRIQQYHQCVATFDWHYHFEYELVLHRHFKGTLFAGNFIGPIEHNHVSIFGPKLAHTTMNQTDHPMAHGDAIIVWFSHQWIRTLIDVVPEFKAVQFMLCKSAQGIQFEPAVGQIIYELLKDHQDLSPAQGFNRILEVLITLSESKQFQYLNQFSLPEIEDNPKEIKLVQKITQYIEENYHQPITTQALCDYVFVSQSTIARLFDRHFGSTFSKHIQSVRIGKACEMLINQNTSISTISDRVGFNNLSNFNRQFKQCKNMTPKAFRQLFG